MQEEIQKERIQDLLLDDSLKETIREMLKSQGIPHHTPCLKVEISDPVHSIFKIDKNDLLKVFSYFGEVKEVKVLGNVALILFKDVISAFFAQKVFNQKAIPELNVVLLVSWYYYQDESLPSPLSDVQNTTTCKYTARFDIQIENDEEFQVARKLIGPKGVNMKNIVEKCCQGLNGPVHDIIKLRLRGKGSGFKEGPDQLESSESLHICISSKYSELLQIASEEVEKLILSVYKEYYAFRAKKGLLDIKLNLKKFI